MSPPRCDNFNCDGPHLDFNCPLQKAKRPDVALLAPLTLFFTTTFGAVMLYIQDYLATTGNPYLRLLHYATDEDTATPKGDKILISEIKVENIPLDHRTLRHDLAGTF
ncbi:hypothetical protein BDR22DRAFT_824776 [Usnea florida]